MAARGTERRGVPARESDAPLDLRPLPRRFFARPTPDVARDLLGKLLLRRLQGRIVGGWIVEVEAYVGEDDPACHAAGGRTARNSVMYGPAGHAYVYFTYGMHHCVNVVTGRIGRPEAVLIRALEPAAGLAAMRRRRPGARRDLDLARGPGRLCQALAIDRRLDGAPLLSIAGAAPLLLARGRPGPAILGVSARIGIRKGVDAPWRYFDADSPWVSPARPGPPRSTSNRVDRSQDPD